VADKPSDSDAPLQGARRKVRPPVIELEATDVTPEEPKRAESPAEDAVKSEPEMKAQSGTQSAPETAQRNVFRAVAVAGVVGALVGALGVALVFIFTGDGISRFAGQSAAVSSPSDGSSSRVERIAKAASDLEKRLVAVENRGAPQSADLAPLASRTEGIETALSDLRRLIEQTQVAHSASNEAIAGRIAAIENRLTQSARTSVDNAAEIAALGALREAIIKGSPFTRELAAARKILGDRATPLASLGKSAETGLPTIATLSARFTELAPKLAREPESNTGYFARLLAHAGRLIEVRPVGEVQGVSAGAVVARIETRLARGDLQTALEEVSKLPSSAKTDASNWIVQATSRHDAEASVKNLLNVALANSAEQPK
jgi:hypothetical protein